MTSPIPLFSSPLGPGIDNLNALAQYVNGLALIINSLIIDDAALRIALTSPVVVTASDTTVIVRLTSPGPVAVSVPAPTVRGEKHTIKDGTGDAGNGTNSITITPTSGLIDGAATAVIGFNYGALTLEADGTQWNATA